MIKYVLNRLTLLVLTTSFALKKKLHEKGKTGYLTLRTSKRVQIKYLKIQPLPQKHSTSPLQRTPVNAVSRIITVYSDNKKPINTLWENAELFIIKAGCTCNYHWVLKVLNSWIINKDSTKNNHGILA
jgi:hypothetical protein